MCEIERRKGAVHLEWKRNGVGKNWDGTLIWREVDYGMELQCYCGVVLLKSLGLSGHSGAITIRGSWEGYLGERELCQPLHYPRS